MNKPEMMREELNQYEWYSMGYDGIYIYTYIARVREASKSHAHIKAEIDVPRKIYRFIPCYKKMFSTADILAMLKKIEEFQRVAAKYGYKFEEVIE